jgi:enoyl-CoA hydratase/carnithine racemase
MDDQQVLVDVWEGVGIITLNRPRAINALSAAMIASISGALGQWQSDPKVRAVLIEGNGEKGFCAGGDVREVRGHVIAGNRQAATDYFAAEYALNLLIGTYTKPIIALQDGICFGGGLGLSAHARFRVGTERSKFAMPESAIGLFADVGVTHRMGANRSGAAIGFLISGQVVGTADAIILDLCDLLVPTGKLGALRGRLIGAIGAAAPGDTEAVIQNVLDEFGVSTGEAVFCKGGTSFFGELDVKTPKALIAAITGLASRESDPAAVKFSQLLAGLCPTSIIATFLRYRACPPGKNMADALAADLRLARYIAGRNDFLDAVHSVLELRQPMINWSPARLADVEVGALQIAMTVA